MKNVGFFIRVHIWNHKVKNIINSVVCGEWEDKLDLVDANSVDCIITSPPCNIQIEDIDEKVFVEYGKKIPYEEYLFRMTVLFAQAYRVLKTGGRLCIHVKDGSNGQVPIHADFISLIRERFKFKMMTTIIWKNKGLGSSTAWGSYMSPSCPSFRTPFDYIIVAAKGTRKHEGHEEHNTITQEQFLRNSTSFWEAPEKRSKLPLKGFKESTPLELSQRLIEQLTYENDLVVDPFNGIGSTCVSAKKLCRRFIGIEQSQELVNVANKWLSETEVEAKYKSLFG